MKKAILFLSGILLLASCSQKNNIESPADRWNGYEKFLKAGEVTYDLFAGKNILVGTVTYGITEDANFYATYDCS